MCLTGTGNVSFFSEEDCRMAQTQTKRKILCDYVVMTFGTALMSVGVYFFKIPNGFSTGGVSGLATILGSLTPVTAATWISIFNVALLLVGFLFLGKSTGVRTVFCSLLFSGFTQALEFLVPLKAPLTDQPLLELIYAMLLTSIGSAVIFFRRGSSGGTDIVALIIKKYFKLNVGKALLCTDALIALCSFFVFDVRTGLFSLLGLFFKAFLVLGDNLGSALLNICHMSKHIVKLHDKVIL